MRTDMTDFAMTEILGTAYLGLQMQRTIIKMISHSYTSSNNYKLINKYNNIIIIIISILVTHSSFYFNEVCECIFGAHLNHNMNTFLSLRFLCSAPTSFKNVPVALRQRYF